MLKQALWVWQMASVVWMISAGWIVLFFVHLPVSFWVDSAGMAYFNGFGNAKRCNWLQTVDTGKDVVQMEKIE